MEVIEIPGHTSGRIGLYCREKRLFFASDGINGGTWLFLPESSSLSVYLESLRKVQKLDFDYLLTGHSTDFFPKSVLEDYVEVAEKLDFAHARIVPETACTPGVERRVCHVPDNSKRKRKNKAFVVISKDKL